MSIEQLHSLVPPPVSPQMMGNEEGWNQIEEEIGIVFPSDYRECISLYGSGGFGGLLILWIFSPFRRDINYVDEIQSVLDAYRELKEEFPDWHPFLVYPEVGGLYPWGITDNGDTFYWQTSGNPDNWSTVLYNPRHSHYEIYDMSMTTFISTWLLDQLKSEILATQRLERSFVPYTMETQ